MSMLYIYTWSSLVRKFTHLRGSFWFRWHENKNLVILDMHWETSSATLFTNLATTAPSPPGQVTKWIACVPSCYYYDPQIKLKSNQMDNFLRSSEFLPSQKNSLHLPPIYIPTIMLETIPYYSHVKVLSVFLPPVHIFLIYPLLIFFYCKLSKELVNMSKNLKVPYNISIFF